MLFNHNIILKTFVRDLLECWTRLKIVKKRFESFYACVAPMLFFDDWRRVILLILTYILIYYYQITYLYFIILLFRSNKIVNSMLFPRLFPFLSLSAFYLLETIGLISLIIFLFKCYRTLNNHKILLYRKN